MVREGISRAERIANPQLSREDFEHACYVEKKVEGCYSLGEWYQVVGNDYPKAAKIYDENCFRGENANSCHKLARLYQFWATHGTTLKGSPTLSREGDAPVALDKLPTSVDGGIRALGTPEERSAALYARACALGNGAACNVGGRMAVKGYGRDVNVADALQMFEHGCEECSDAHSCLLSGQHIFGENGMASRQTALKRTHGLIRRAERACKCMPNRCRSA